MEKGVFKVRDGSLEKISTAGNTTHIVSLESAEWYEWLESHHSFYFESTNGNFTARKEQRSGGWYWYAYCRRDGILSTTYLGKSKSLTLERLQTIAKTFKAKPPQALRRSRQHMTSSSYERVQQETLLLTKLQVPPLNPNLISRSSLLERLNTDIHNKLILLSAPAGSGKTTLLSEWAAYSSWPVSWFSLDESDNDPIRFWRYIIAALENTQPGIGEHALALLCSPQTVPIEAVITALVNAITSLSLDLALVLDDYHFIDAQAIHEALIFFLDHLPANIHLLIASRVDPPLPLPRLRGHCRLAELRLSDLRFTSDEVVTFFSHTTHLNLSPEAIASLEAFTEGWIAGLQLAAISLQRSPDISGFLKAFTRNDLYIFDYLVNEVWQRQPRNIQNFLLKAAILERLNGSLCNALTGQGNGQQLLEQLEKANLFIVRLDNQRCWYRLHHLFRAFLCERLQTLQPEKMNELHLRACHWHEQHGLMTEAIHHAFAAGDFLRAAKLVMNVGQTLLRNHEMVTLLQWLNAFPDELVAALPRLCLFRGWLHIASGQFLSSQFWLQRAQQGIDNKVASPLPCTSQELRLVKGEIAALRSHLAVFLGDIPSAFEFAHQALNLLPEDDLFLRSLGELNLGVTNWLNNDVQAAIHALTKAEIIGQAANNIYVILTAACIFTHIQMAQGQLHRAFQTNQQAIQLATEKKVEALWATASAYISLGQLLYIWNNLEEAERSLQEGIALSIRWQHRDLMVYGYTVMAQVKQAQGDSLTALKMVQLAEQSIQENQPHPWLVSVMAALQIQLALMQKNFDAIEQWHQTQMCNYVRTFEQMALAQVSLAQNQLDRAMQILEQQLQKAEETKRIGTVIDIRLLQAQVYQRWDAMKEALQTLGQALILAEPEGYIRPFVNAGPSLKSLLELLLAQGEKAPCNSSQPVPSAYIRKLLMAFELPADLQTKPSAESQQVSLTSRYRENLSKRETEIIHLVIAGLSAQEIAQQIVLAENTVKWHIRNIYSKLHVHNRAQVVSRALELGL